MLPNVLNGLQEGTLTAEPQDDSKASVTKLINKSDAQIDWASPAEYIERMIRAYDSWPGTFTSWNGKILKVLDAQISSASASGPAVGAGVVVINEGRVNVGTGSASIELKKVQLEGRQAIAAADFVMGQPDFHGGTLGM
jgi:methionyl-tRNA formyltransferase